MAKLLGKNIMCFKLNFFAINLDILLKFNEGINFFYEISYTDLLIYEDLNFISAYIP